MEKLELWAGKLVDQLAGFHNKGQQTGLIITPVKKLHNLLSLPSLPLRNNVDHAKYIALEYLECSLDALLYPPKKNGIIRAAKKTDYYLTQIKSFKEIKNILALLQKAIISLQAGEQFSLFSPDLLLRSVVQAKEITLNIEASQNGELVANDKRHLTIIMGEKVVYADGQMKSKPDPVSVAYTRPNIEAQRRFIENIVLLYEWAGGKAYTHRNAEGRDIKPKSQFMHFLDSIKEALPEHAKPRGNAFYGMVNSTKKS